VSLILKVFIMRNLEELLYIAKNSIKDVYKLRSIFNEVKHILEFEFNIRGKKNSIREYISKPIVFFGDIHGDVYTLIELMAKLNVIEYLNNNALKLVFLGDYIDRGPNQLLTLTLLFIMKLEWRDNIVLLRGNHEPVKGLEPYPHDFPQELIENLGIHNGQELYYEILNIFEFLPLLLYIPKKILAFHGGPPLTRLSRYSNIDDILNIESKEDFEDILWSDPSEDIEYLSYNIYRGAGKLWGWRISKDIAEKLDIKIMVRGHEPCNGFKINHKGLVVTIFSMKGYYGNSFAAALKVPEDYSWVSNIESHMLLV